MPSISHSFVVDYQQQLVWVLLTNFESFGPQLPHVVSVKYLDEERKESKWTVKGSVGPVTKAFNIIVKITEKSPTGFLAFQGEGDGLKISGKAAAEAMSQYQTKVSINLEIEASSGIIGSIVNHVIESELPQDIMKSEDKIRELLREIIS